MHRNMFTKGLTAIPVQDILWYKIIKIGVQSQMKGIRPIQLKVKQANRYMYLFGKMCVIYYVCQRMMCRNAVEGQENV